MSVFSFAVTRTFSVSVQNIRPLCKLLNGGHSGTNVQDFLGRRNSSLQTRLFSSRPLNPKVNKTSVVIVFVTVGFVLESMHNTVDTCVSYLIGTGVSNMGASTRGPTAPGKTGWMLTYDSVSMVLHMKWHNAMTDNEVTLVLGWILYKQSLNTKSHTVVSWTKLYITEQQR